AASPPAAAPAHAAAPQRTPSVAASRAAPQRSPGTTSAGPSVTQRAPAAQRALERPSRAARAPERTPASSKAAPSAPTASKAAPGAAPSAPVAQGADVDRLRKQQQKELRSQAGKVPPAQLNELRAQQSQQLEQLEAQQARQRALAGRPNQTPTGQNAPRVAPQVAARIPADTARQGRFAAAFAPRSALAN